MSLESALFSSRTVLSDLSDVFSPSNPLSSAAEEGKDSFDNAVPYRQAKSSTSGRAPDDASSVQPEVSRIWSLLFSKTDPTPIAPLSIAPLTPGKLASFTASHFELVHERHMSTSSERVGEGACYLVEKRTLSSVHGSLVVAIKTPKLRGSTPSRQVASLILRELQVLTHTPLHSHPNIASIIGYLPHIDRGSSLGLSIVAELAGHGTLREYLARPLTHGESPHSLMAKLSLLHDVASGLEALHACGIVQGDVKTENVLVFAAREGQTGDVVAKLSDFGHAIILDHGRSGEPRHYLGTAVLNSPEARQRNSLAVADLCKCDVFSYGLIVWETVINGARYLSCCEVAASREQEGVLGWLQSLPEDELLRLALESIDHIHGASEPPLIDVLQRLVKASLRDDRNKRSAMGDIVKTFRRQAFLAAISRKRRANKSFSPQPLIQVDERGIGELVHQDDFGISPMPVRQSIIQQLEELSRSPLESSWSRQRLSLNLALASLSNFVGKADPTNGMAKLREAASMGSVTALAIHCRLCNFFDAEEALLSSLDPHSAMSELARQLMALPEDSDLSKWLRALADHRQRQAWKTKIQVSIGDRLLADGVLMADIPNCLERLTTLDVSRLTVSVVDQTEYLDEEENPCFESPLLLAVACRIGHLDIVRTLLGSKLQQQHQQQYGPSRELVASCLLQACRGGQIDVVEHIVRNAVDGLGPMLWPDNETGIHWLFMFQPDDQRKALDLMVEIDARHWHTDLLDKVPEPGIRLGLATVSGTPVEFATCVGATSTVEILVEKITWLQGQSRLGELSENTFRRALTSHMAAIVRTLLPLEIRRRRANRVDAALARLRLSQGKTEFESFGIFDVGRSVSSLSLALLHGSTEAVAKATDNTIDVLTRSGVAAINDIVSRHEMGHTPLADAVRWAPCSFDADVLAAFISRGANFGDMPQAVVLSRLVAPRPAGTKGLVMTKLLRAGLLNINPGLTLQAVQTGDAEIVGAILDHAPSGISANYALKEDDDATEITLLQAAALVPGGAELVQSLLDRGASIDETLGHLSPLELAIAKPSDAPIIDILIDRGASLKSSKYSTVIHFAASLSVAINGTHILSHLLGHPRVRAMLAALPTKSDEQQLSPVHMACFSANVAAIAALLEVGVELPHYNDTWDVLAISVFIGKRPHMNVLSPISEQDEDAIYDWKLKSERLILYLLDRLEPGHGRTPLHVACQVGNLRHVRQIIQEDIEALNAEDANGSLPVDFIEDANALEEQRLTREDVTEHTVANARRVYECVETALRDEIAASQRDMEHQFEATFKMLDLEQHDGTVSESSRGLMLDMTSESVDNSLSAAERVINSFWKVLEEAEAKTTDSALEVFVPSPGEGEEKALATLKQCETVVLDGYDGPEDILPKARSLLERKTQELGELHEDTLEAAEVVVDLLGILNKQEEVSEMVNQLLERRRLSLPEHDPRIFYTWRDRVIMLMNGGQNEDAVRETREAVAVAKRCWGSSHTAYLTFVPTLAALKCIEGKYDECVSMNMELLETLQAPEFQGRRGIGVRSEAVVHLCYHSMNKGDLDGIRRGIDGCLDCLGSADPKDFLARFDAAVSLARTAEQVNTGLANNMWTGLVQVCGSRLEPRSHCELEAQRHLAAHLMSREMFDDARVQYQKLIEDLTLRKGPKHLETLLVIVDDARALHKQRLTPAALQLLRPAVRELEKRHPSETNDEHSLRAKTLLAEMLLEQDNVDDWELVAREVASGYARLDRKSDAAVDAKRTLATTLGRTERAAEAVQIAQECLELTQEAYGENHERTLAVAGEVQLYLTRCGHWGDSVAMCERALAIAKAVCGESSTQVADWLYLLGTSLGLAEREGGLDKLLQSIDIALKLNDGVHSRSSLTSMWSAAVHMRQKTPTKALEVLTEALKACNDIITDEPHSLKVRIRTDIGRCHTDLKQYEDGFAHLEQAHRESRQLWGDSSRETISVVDSLVTVLSLLERYKEALPLAHEVLEYAESTAGSSDDETILAASSLADLYFALDKCSAAERLWEQALKGLAAQGEDADQDKVASCRHNHAQALIGILDFEAAKDLLALSFDHYSQAKGPGAKETLTVSITRAQVERLLENPAAAEAILLTVMEAARRAADLSEVLEHAEASLGGLWVKMGRYEDAEEVLSRAVERKGADFTARAQLCTAYKNQMKYEEAEEQAAILLSMVPEHLDEQAIEVELRLLRLYMDMGDSDHAQAWADTLFARMKGLNDYQGNPLDLLGALESLIEYFEQTQDEQRLFETRLILEHIRQHLPLRLHSNLYMRISRSKQEE